jgi:hypothetical protein
MISETVKQPSAQSWLLMTTAQYQRAAPKAPKRYNENIALHFALLYTVNTLTLGKNVIASYSYRSR